ncbi:MAG: AEC family transporter [Lachnospiraceae bacterium]|nr:AEC family transporter [Lachnospiraceae bacterium]
MSIWIVQKQMIIIFLLILVGVYLYKKKHLTGDGARQISWIVVNVTNPITLLCAALSEEQKAKAGDLLVAFLCFAVMYAVLIPVANIIPAMLKVEKGRRYAYKLLAIFGNVGFIGIPFSSAVLGPSSLIFVSICGLTFNMVIYTYGVYLLKKTAAEQHPGEDAGSGFSLKDMINSGTVMSVVIVAVYLLDIKVPDMIDSTLSFIGNCTTFLSMIVLGVSVAQMVPKEVFSRWRLYVFVLVRQIIIPILFIFLFRPFIKNELILSTITVMVAMPGANMPLMMAKQYGVKEDILSAGIILTTVATLITIPAVMYFL